MALIGASQRVEALLHLSEQICRGRQELEVVRIQRPLAIGQRQRGVRCLPIEAPDGRATSQELTRDVCPCLLRPSRVIVYPNAGPVQNVRRRAYRLVAYVR